MKQRINKRVRQKTKNFRVNGKLYYSNEENEEKIIEINKEIKTIKRTIRHRRKYNNYYDDLSLRISELKKSEDHYKSDLIVLKNRIVEFEGL